ncbi:MULTISPECIES: WxcM-like domain-containing protein [Flavobacteriaceae]|uniref:Sugar 3,4-ketoisomerase QdtA cupin domain-containing protein n=2 Tax=Flavobacteriaceae TaxID=49546 RepID=A0A4Y8AYU7_9FLAO|nr:MULTISPECIES: WxcM-like domain-containing protein [Flavobacteriaceae]TEW77018.1 hypothetical protein E2488_03990 [Gramella jeungdoensis]GGK60732.1 sugar epimerase [Lutibacter litoralis]
MNIAKPKIIKGGCFKDERGTVSFINDFNMSSIKRMYAIKHESLQTIRAWQGHKIEHKYFKCTKGSFAVAWKKIDNYKCPSDLPLPEYHILKASENQILSIPPGYMNGLKAIEKNAEILVFSNLNLEASLKDSIRFENKLWLDWFNNIR